MYFLRIIFLICCAWLHLSSKAQLKAGLTGIADTSFNTRAEYNKLKKSYPNVEIVNDFHAGSIREKRGIPYCAAGKRSLLIDAFYPASATKEKRPAVMIIFGGGWRSGNTSQHHPMAQRLADLGYVCFTPDYRLSTEALYPAAVYDLKAALRWIRAHAREFNVDTDKIAVAGFSAGGQLAALLGTTMNNPQFEAKNCNAGFSTSLAAVIDMDGVLAFIHPESGEGDDSKKISAATYWFGYSKTEKPELWKEASPLNHVSSTTPPTLFINSSVGRMHAGRDEYINVLNHFGTVTEVKTFSNAPHSFPLFHPWFDSTVKIIDGFLKKVFGKQKSEKLIRVAADGSGDYLRVQDAFDAIPLNNSAPVTIFVKSGLYKEKLHLDSTKRLVSLVGENKFNTVLTFDDHSGKIGPRGDTINTYTSQSFLEGADDFTATNISFQNNAGFSAGQAVAVQIKGDRVKFANCRFIGNQDVLFPSRPNTRQYFEHCFIEGTTDFIFGPSAAWFEQCHINSKKNSHITAASTPVDQSFGYVFNDCILTADSSYLAKVSLGRPWRPYASVTYINCYMGAHILPEGWNNWNNNTANERTARYAEYRSYGPGANPAKRFSWTTQLSDEEVKKYTMTNIFGDWNPKHSP